VHILKQADRLFPKFLRNCGLRTAKAFRSCPEPQPGAEAPICLDERRLIRLRIERSDPPSIGVHPIADALHAVEPERAARISVQPGVVTQVPVFAWAAAHSRQPFAFECGEL
jgi:hypothetical protein